MRMESVGNRSQPRPSSFVERAIRSVETASPIDAASRILRRGLTPIAAVDGARDVLTGRALGHPLHPAAVLGPMSCWLGGTIIDLVGGPDGARAAQRLVGLGTLAAFPAAMSGAADWIDTHGAEQRVGTVHALANGVAVGLYATSWFSRRQGHRSTGVALALVGAAVTGMAGYLGGHLAYRRGVGVDTTAFQSGPQEWAPVDIEGAFTTDAPTEGRIGAMSFVVTQLDGESTPGVLESRCTHRGGPLHDGDIDGDCVVCPWHGSRFDSRTGAVRRGPAPAPQPAYDVRVDGERVLIRRDEEGGLRTNPIGAATT